MEWNFHFFRWKWKRDRQKSGWGKRGRTKPYLATNRRSLTSILNWKTDKVKRPNPVLPTTIHTFASGNEKMKGREVSTSQTIVVSTWQHNQNKVKAAFWINQGHYGFKILSLFFFLFFFSGWFFFYPMGCKVACCDIWQRSMFPEHYSVSTPGLVKKKTNEIHRN